MHNLLRWSVFAPIAAGLTFGLFLLMRFLISAEFSPQEKICLLYTSPSPRD